MGRWTAGPVYIFPGSGSQTTLSITLDDSKGSHTYGYVSKVVPQANHPYNIGGSYTGDISIDGSLIAKGWEDAIDASPSPSPPFMSLNLKRMKTTPMMKMWMRIYREFPRLEAF